LAKTEQAARKTVARQKAPVGKSKSNPFVSSLEKLPPSPRKEDVRSHDGGHVSKGGGFRVSVTGSRWLGYSKIGEICAIHTKVNGSECGKLQDSVRIGDGVSKVDDARTSWGSGEGEVK
jgi:hypothetical protein